MYHRWLCARRLRGALPFLRVSGPVRARFACRGPRIRVRPAYTFFTRSRLNTDWRAYDAWRPSAVGDGQFSPALKAAPHIDHQPWRQFSVLFKTLDGNGASDWRLISPPLNETAHPFFAAHVRVGRWKKAAESGRLDHVYGFPSRQSASPVPRANKSLVAKNGSAEDKLFHLVRFTNKATPS